MADKKVRERISPKLPKGAKKSLLKGLLIYLILGIIGAFFFFGILEPGKIYKEVPLSQVLADVREGRVESILVEGNRLTVKQKDGEVLSSYKESGEGLLQTFKAAEIDPGSLEITVREHTLPEMWLNAISTVVPLVLMGLFFAMIFRQARGAQDTLFSFGRSRAKLFSREIAKVTFKDVAGVDEAKEELKEVVDFLKNPKKYHRMGARTPKGALLVGPSGTGKTLLARAVAGEANVPFFSMAGSEFMEMLVGVGSARMRDLFQTAKKNAPSIIFIDEVEGIGRTRSVTGITSHDEREQTLNQMLVEMDGFEPHTAVLVIAASVIGETPILVKQKSQVQLIPIASLVDQYFDSDREEGEKEVEGVKCLGFERKSPPKNLRGRLYFKSSAFKKVRSVFRHKVKEIYEIEYLGGRIRATGNHSVFVRSRQGLKTKAVSQLKKGDVLIDLPFKVNRGSKKLMEVRSHFFDSSWLLTLPFFTPRIEEEWQEKYLFAIKNVEGFSQSQIAQTIGVSQTTVSHWQRGIGNPRPISRAYFKHQFPEKVKVTPELCRLFGYYVAEGYARKEVDFCFSLKEKANIKDLIFLVEYIFGIKPDFIREITPGAVNIVYSASPLAKFFIHYCGRGAKNKHIPPFLFEAPSEYFVEFLRGVWRGDGYEDKKGRGEITSVSKQLIYELNWLCRMHGIKTYVGGFWTKEGRRIKNGKPLKAVYAYRLGWGKANNPFKTLPLLKTYPVKRAIVEEVKRVPFNGFVYDLCGVENEAFFGGESPILLHNSNRPDLLDPALVRPGRFDRRIVLDLPDIGGRKAILKIHMKGKPFAKSVDWDKVAKRTVGFSGADLENMLNEAAILAARQGRQAIGMDDLEEAATKVKLGPEKKRLQSEEDRKMTAYHEAGHAVVAFNLPHMDPVHRVSIVARGLALGFVLTPPTKDRYTETRSHLLEQVTAALGGRAAEEMVFSEFTSGAASDIVNATKIIRRMVIEYGMSELGPINLGPQFDELESGRMFLEPTQLSPDMQAKVDDQIKKMADECYRWARKILRRNKRKLNLVAEELLKVETIEGERFEEIMKKKD